MKTNFFSNYTKKDRVQNFSTKPAEPYEYHLRQYYIAQDYLKNYTEAIALFGTRRLGKTVTLNQLWDTYHTENSLYLKVSEETLMDEVLEYIKQKENLDFLFIDEITNILALDMNAADLLDYCKAYNIKVVVTGTNSFLLSVAFRNSAAGRFKVISFNPPNFQDLVNVKNTKLEDFILGLGSFYQGNNYLADISNDIIKAIDYLGNYRNEPLYSLSSEELISNIEIIVELIIFNKENKLPRNGLVFTRKFYSNLNFDDVIYRTQSPKETVYYVYNVLTALNLITELPIKSFDDITNKYKLYLTTPVLYKGLVDKYSVKALPTKLGILFESIVVSQIKQIFNNNLNFQLYTFRDEAAMLEYDLVIEDKKGKTLYLNEIKYSDTKYGKYKNNKMIEDFYNEYRVTYIDITPKSFTHNINFYKTIVFQ